VLPRLRSRVQSGDSSDGRQRQHNEYRALSIPPRRLGHPAGRPSDHDAVQHAIKETRDGLELVETLIDLMRNAKAEKTRLAATCELWDRVYGRVPSGERPSLFSALAGASEIHFEASFGPRRAPGDEAKDAAVEVEAQRVDADPAESDAEASVETPVETPE
jgi:hypothetical protein